jgi:hypothetical protein
MSDAPISAPEPESAEAALVEAARAWESGDAAGAAALWRERSLPRIEAEWPEPLAAAFSASLRAVLLHWEGRDAVEAGRRTVLAWERVEGWLGAAAMPLGGGRSTPAHFRKLRRDPEAYRSAARGEDLRLCGAARAVALNTLGAALSALGRDAEALSAYIEAAELRRRAFGWREAGLGAILGNRAKAERRIGRDASATETELAKIARDPVPVGADRYLALAAGRHDLRRWLLAGAELVPILRPASG